MVAGIKITWEELEGKTFGLLKPISIAASSIHQKTMVNCICKCGKAILIQASKLINNITPSCGCNNVWSWEDFEGKTFGKLTPVSMKAPDSKLETHNRVNCICECGKTCSPVAGDVATGRTGSCGCERSIVFKRFLNRQEKIPHRDLYKIPAVLLKPLPMKPPGRK